MKEPLVDDASSEVVEVIRQKSPTAALNMALQMDMAEPDKSASTLKEVEEEKKEDPTTEENEEEQQGSKEIEAGLSFEEEGQEALWVEDDQSESSPIKKERPLSPHRRSLFFGGSKKSLHKESSGERSSKKKKSTKHDGHVMLLPSSEQTSNNTTNAAAAVDPAKKREAALKADTARKLLHQALSAHANVGSRELLARSAFEQAVEARKLMLTADEMTEEMGSILEDAKTKGCAAVATVRELQLQQQQPKHGDKDDQKDKEGPPVEIVETGPAETDEYASRAQQLLEFILPAGIETVGTSQTPVDDISTIGFDNTFASSSNGGKEFDILSMSSLNEILDGPLEEASPLRHRILPDAKPTENPATTTKTNAPATAKSSASKKSGIFGSIFRASGKAAPSESASKAPRRLPPRAEKKDKKGAKKEIQRFVATVMVDEGTGEETTMQREISNLSELEKFKNVDAKTQNDLKQALAVDDAESLTSLEGVKLYGKQNEGKKDKKNQGNAPEAAIAQSRGSPPRSPPRDFEKVKPKFILAPRGDPEVLTQKSWENLVEEGAVAPKDLPVVTRSDSETTASSFSEQKQQVARQVEGGDNKATLDIDLPPSESLPSTTVGSDGDRYTIGTNSDTFATHSGTFATHSEDRYIAIDENGSFEAALWNPCTANDLNLLEQGSSTILPYPSTMSSTSINLASFEDERGVVGGDRYSQLGQSSAESTGASTKSTGTSAKSSKAVAEPRASGETPSIQAKKSLSSAVGGSTRRLGGLFGLRRGKNVTVEASAAHSGKGDLSARDSKSKKMGKKKKETPLKTTGSLKQSSKPQKSVLSEKQPKLQPSAALPKVDPSATEKPTASRVDEEATDPMLIMIKEQQHHHRKGVDPISNADIRRGIDP